MKLLIRNINRNVTQAQLRSMFESCGTVQSCDIVLDKDTGISKGFGFVEMPKPGEAKAATKLLNGKDIEGSKIRVKKADTKQIAQTKKIVEPKQAAKARKEPSKKALERNPYNRSR